MNPPPLKKDLIDMGNGVYQYPDFGGVTVRVRNLQYKLCDNNGQPLPPRNGDPVFGTMEVGITGGGEYMVLEPTSQDNSFTIARPILVGGNVGFNTIGWHHSMITYFDSFRTYINSGGTGINPAHPSLVNFVYSDLGAPSIQYIFGKLIRSTTGSTFALAAESYPEPFMCPNASVPWYTLECPLYCIAHPNDSLCQ